MADAHVHVVGQTPGRSEGMAGGSFTDVSDAFGNSTAEALLEARERGLTLYAEDVLVRGGAIQEGVPTFGTVGLLYWMLDEGTLTQGELDDYMLRLLGLRYSRLPVSISMLVRSVERAFFVPDAVSLLPFQALESRPDFDAGESAFEVAAGFLRWLWLNAVHQRVKRDWLDVVLRALCTGREPSKVAAKLLAMQSRIVHWLAPDREEFSQEINRWLTLLSST